MFLLAHLFVGLIIGKIFGNYVVALLGALIIDIDHLVPYIKHKIIFRPKKLCKTITNPKDPYGNQRNYLHSVFLWAVISIIIILINFNIGLIFSLAYFSHLLFDALDNSNFYPFYPLKYNLKGPIGYLSVREFMFTLILLILFLVV